MTISSVKKQVLERFSLSNEQVSKLDKKAKEIVNKIKKVNSKNKVSVGGSLAKRTLVEKPVQDVDIFVTLDDPNELEKIITKSGLKARKIHGSRDYFKIEEEIDGKPIIFEIIPVKEMVKEDDVDNVTDFSLEHVKYVRSKLSNKLADEIKIAKLFCNANNCYGAESYINGFSGYALELLIIQFKTFENFLKKIQKERIIDPKKYFRDKNKILSELNESKLKSPVILIDPVYKYRNVAAGLSENTFEKLFLPAVKKFLKNPSIDFFEIKEFDEKKFMRKAKNGKDYIELDFETDKQEGDIAATKMKKFFDFLIRVLEDKGQKVSNSHFEYFHENPESKKNGRSAKGYLIIKTKSSVERKGPPLNLDKAVKDFKKSNKKFYKKNNHLYVKDKISLEDVFKFAKRYEKDMDVKFKIS